MGAATPARAQLQKQEIGDLRLVFISPTETFLVPHAGRTFVNSSTFLEKLFDYKPKEKITVLLDRFLRLRQRRRHERAAQHVARADRAAQLYRSKRSWRASA